MEKRADTNSTNSGHKECVMRDYLRIFSRPAQISRSAAVCEYLFSVFAEFLPLPARDERGRVGEGGVRASPGEAPPLPGPLLPLGSRGRRDNSETLNTYVC